MIKVFKNFNEVPVGFRGKLVLFHPNYYMEYQYLRDVDGFCGARFSLVSKNKNINIENAFGTAESIDNQCDLL